MRDMNTQGTAIDLEKADAILLLDAPKWESPDVCDTSRASFSYALILAVPVALILAGFAFLAQLTPDLPVVSTLVLGR
ncbi:MAG: hypothetical protein HOP16_07400 [Acidobacteria bacterium]|nr:hypothetical protein [Acidobacteriota bacterium]